MLCFRLLGSFTSLDGYQQAFAVVCARHPSRLWCPMHTHPADPQLSRDDARPNTVLVHRSNLLDRHRRLASLVDSVGLGSFDTGLLALTDEAPFEFGDHPQYRDQDRTG